MNRRRFLQGCLAAGAGAAAGASPVHAAEPRLERTELFRAGEDGYALYRIPGIVRTTNGTLLAYCEARKTASGDWGQIDIMLRRSVDGGRIWQPRRKVVDPPRVPKNPVAVAQKLGKDGEVTVNNPVAIADREPGRVHFLYCVEYARCYYMHSDDDGLSFSRPVDITPTFEQFREEYDWKVIATGPGHGIQLTSGRLLVPIWMSTGTGGHAHRPSAVSVIYSDDGGDTWKRGGIVAAHPTLINPSETVAVELQDGSVMLNIRHEGKEARRAVSISKNGTTGWSAPRLDPQLPEPVCMGSIHRISSQPSRILFANPHNPDNRERKNLTIKLSRDEGKTWPVSRVLEPGISGYCDLAGAGDDLYCFFEDGSVDNTRYRTRALTVARFNLAWLTGE